MRSKPTATEKEREFVWIPRLAPYTNTPTDKARLSTAISGSSPHLAASETVGQRGGGRELLSLNIFDSVQESLENCHLACYAYREKSLRVAHQSELIFVLPYETAVLLDGETHHATQTDVADIVGRSGLVIHFASITLFDPLERREWRRLRQAIGSAAAWGGAATGPVGTEFISCAIGSTGADEVPSGVGAVTGAGAGATGIPPPVAWGAPVRYLVRLSKSPHRMRLAPIASTSENSRLTSRSGTNVMVEYRLARSKKSYRFS